MKVWELLERLEKADPDSIVVVIHQPMLDAMDAAAAEPAGGRAAGGHAADGCDFDGNCPHDVDFHDMKFYGSLPVFAIEKGEII